MPAHYDTIGKTYRRARLPDHRIGAVIESRLGACRRILNIGAGAGSYESTARQTTALEPSEVMIRQRLETAAPAVQGIAEALPFADNTFDAATIFLSIHHWSDWRCGLHEALRVAQGRLLMFTWIGFPSGFWLTEYFPEIIELDEDLFPTVTDLEAITGPLIEESIPIPADCTDGFLCAYWQRPEAYLDPIVRAGMSTFAKIDNIDERILELNADLKSGAWDERFGHLRQLDAFDYGYRVLSCGLKGSKEAGR
ncbi:MAG: class I SAM-dependent methyltransferase [Pseudomonadota bacterium]